MLPRTITQRGTVLEYMLPVLDPAIYPVTQQGVDNVNQPGAANISGPGFGLYPPVDTRICWLLLLYSAGYCTPELPALG